jgi:hypothetical protein
MEQENALLTDHLKILNAFTSALVTDEQEYTKNAVELADAAALEKPLVMTPREVCIFRMGISQGLKRACALMTTTRDQFRNKMPTNQLKLL